MLGRVFGVMVLIALSFGLCGGRGAEMATAVLEGASSAVQLCLALCGMMGLWCGVMRVLEQAGAVRVLSRVLRRPLSFFFPEAAASGEGLEEICANLAANLLGVGNAATPMALAALAKLQRHNPTPEVATDDMIALTVLNTCSLSLIPSTLLALLHTAGATAPFAALLPIWLCSATCATLALVCCRLLRGRSLKK
jgi:spore maturation protein A